MITITIIVICFQTIFNFLYENLKTIKTIKTKKTKKTIFYFKTIGFSIPGRPDLGVFRLFDPTGFHKFRGSTVGAKMNKKMLVPA